MNKRLKETMVDAMSFARVSDLKEWDGKKVWLRAVVKVTKCDNSENYAVADNDGYGKPTIVRDYGNMASIVRIDKIYPALLLKNDDLPNFRMKKDVANYLVKNGYDEEEVNKLMSTEDKTPEQIKEDNEKIKSMVYTTEIKKQTKNL